MGKNYKMVKNLHIQMDDKEFFKLLELKKRLSDNNKVMSWLEYMLLKRVNKKS